MIINPPPSGKLSEFIASVMAFKDCFTDIHIESNEPVMIRKSSSNWESVQSPDGSLAVFTLHQIHAFINGIYTGTEDFKPAMKKPAWEDQLFQHGSLHPATVLSGSVNGEVKNFRVRCSIQKQSMGQSICIVVRTLTDVPNSISELGLPSPLSDHLSSITSGLIVVTGPAGCGKSTTLAGIIEQINQTKFANILTIEDPIEFEFDRKKSIINQREVQVDVPTFHRGVQDALRFVPDAILVGETRDADTMRSVVRAAESGHLVLTSMHAPTTIMAIRKMIALLQSTPADIQSLSGCLVTIIAQALVRGNDGSNVLVYEVLNCRDKIVQQSILGSGSDLSVIATKLKSHSIAGSTPFISRLRHLVKAKHLSPDKAALCAYDPDDRAEFLEMKGF